MHDAATQKVLREVFGSDTEDEDSETLYPGIPGLKLVKQLLSPCQQVSVTMFTTERPQAYTHRKHANS